MKRDEAKRHEEKEKQVRWLHKQNGGEVTEHSKRKPKADSRNGSNSGSSSCCIGDDYARLAGAREDQDRKGGGNEKGSSGRNGN